MDLGNSTLLITGGATGIGFALAERFIKAGSDVIICGRRESALEEAQRRLPSLHVMVADVAHEADRVALAKRVVVDFPRLNVLVNNAGIQRRMAIGHDDAPWAERQAEIAINFEAPVHLTSLLLAHLAARPNAALVNVTSGLAFVPAVFAPVYSATKAALHSFTVSLRHDLSRQGIEVIEIVPPAVDTDLGGKGVHANATPPPEFADAVMLALSEGRLEIGYGFSEQARRASRDELDALALRFAR